MASTGRGWACEKMTAFLEARKDGFVACKAKKKYQTFMNKVTCEWSMEFPIIEELFPGRKYEALCDDEKRQHAEAWKKRQDQIKDWFRWRCSPRNRKSSGSDNLSKVEKSLVNIIYDKARKKKPYEKFAELFPEAVEKDYREACSKEGKTGKGCLPIWTRVAKEKWDAATSEQREAVETSLNDDEKEDCLQATDAPRRLIDAVPGILAAALGPLAQKTGLAFFVAYIGPFPGSNGAVKMRTIQHGEHDDAPVLGEVFPEYEQVLLDKLAPYYNLHVKNPDDAQKADFGTKSKPTPLGSSARQNGGASTKPKAPAAGAENAPPPANKKAKKVAPTAPGAANGATTTPPSNANGATAPPPSNENGANGATAPPPSDVNGATTPSPIDPPSNTNGATIPPPSGENGATTPSPIDPPSNENGATTSPPSGENVATTSSPIDRPSNENGATTPPPWGENGAPIPPVDPPYDEYGAATPPAIGPLSNGNGATILASDPLPDFLVNIDWEALSKTVEDQTKAYDPKIGFNIPPGLNTDAVLDRFLEQYGSYDPNDQYDDRPTLPGANNFPEPEPEHAEDGDPRDDQPSTRRSRRAPAPSKRLEHQNLIGTNALLNSSTSDKVAEDMTVWFEEASAWLGTVGLGQPFESVLGAWQKLEESLEYGTVNKGSLPVPALRPSEWRSWTSKGRSGHRAYDQVPKIAHADAPEFGLTVLKWWNAMQPSFRQDPQGGLPLPLYGEECSEDVWRLLRRGGPNGLVAVVTVLAWWGVAAQVVPEFVKDTRSEWLGMVSDVTRVMEQMAKVNVEMSLKRPSQGGPGPRGKKARTE